MKLKNKMSNNNQRWLTLPADKLINNNTKEMKIVDRFLEMGLPVLKRYKSGFMGEVGDIQVCLLIHLNDDNSMVTEVCHINDEGELKSRLEEKGSSALELVKSFVLDYPEAVFTTESRKPLCLFSSKSDKKNLAILSKSGATEGSAGKTQSDASLYFMGYMNLKTFKTILSADMNKITVAVP